MAWKNLNLDSNQKLEYQKWNSSTNIQAYEVETEDMMVHVMTALPHEYDEVVVSLSKDNWEERSIHSPGNK